MSVILAANVAMIIYSIVRRDWDRLAGFVVALPLVYIRFNLEYMATVNYWMMAIHN
jgi:hypothetical protein